MFEAWGRRIYRARRLTLIATLLFAIAAGLWGTGVFGRLTAGDTFTPPASQSNAEAARADSLFGRDGADVVVLFHSADRTVADPAYRQAVTSYLEGLPAGQVTGSVTYWTRGQRDLVSADRHSTYAALRLAGRTDQQREAVYKAIKTDFAAGRPTASRPRPVARFPPRSRSTQRSARTSPGRNSSRSRCCSSCS